MNLTSVVFAERPARPVDPSLAAGPGGGAEGNSRLTGGVGAALFVILAVEAAIELQSTS